VEAFEPQASCVEVIRAYGSSRINVHVVALGARAGELTLNIPVRDGNPERSLASFRAAEGDVTRLIVPIKKLDDYGFTDVTMIKIDVEGFESDVIEGARETIEREKPLLLVEIEQRHLGATPIERVFERLESFGYRGSFFSNGQVRPIAEFSVERDQLANVAAVHDPRYINNFVFTPANRGWAA
jgi:FkbM family methyltransferase